MKQSNVFILSSILIFQTLVVNGMDIASLSQISVQEIETVARKEKIRLQQWHFGSIGMDDRINDGHYKTTEIDPEILIKDYVIPTIVAQRLALAQGKKVVISEEELKKEITANVISTLKESKK